MKIPESLLLSLLLSTVVSAQTNTFPASGNVGVGTTSPEAALDVTGSAIFGSATDRPIVLWENSGSISIQGDSGGWAFGLHAKGYLGTWRAGFGFFGAGDDLQYAYIGDSYANPTMVVQPDNGNVGIGTANPQGKLEVNDVSGVGVKFDLSGGLGKNLIIKNSGQNDVPFAQYPGAWTPALLIQNNDSSRYLWFSPLDAGSGGNARVVTGGSDFDIMPGNQLAATFTETGNVGIGTRNPTQKLSVNGTVRAKEVIVDSGWSDYVFAPDYKLPPLSEVEQHIKSEQHLPGIPSAKDVAEHGVGIGEMQAKLLAKLEELTLHQIAQEKEIAILKDRLIHIESAKNR
jgi:hypothetical protein